MQKSKILKEFFEALHRKWSDNCRRTIKCPRVKDSVYLDPTQGLISKSLSMHFLPPPDPSEIKIKNVK